MNSQFATHALQSVLSNADYLADFNAFCRTVSPRFRNFRSQMASSAADGTGFELAQEDAHKTFCDWFDDVLVQKLKEMGITETELESATSRNLQLGDASAQRLMEQLQCYEDFLQFGKLMQDKYDEIFSESASSSSSGGGGDGKRRVRVLWDIENVRPGSMGGLSATIRLNDFLRTQGLFGPGVDTLVTVFINARAIESHRRLMDELDKSNVEIVRTSDKREDSDRKLSLRLRREMDVLPPAATTIVLISSDQDFRNDVQLAVQRGFDVTVLHNAPKASRHAQTLAMYATRVFHWVDDVGMPPETQTPSSGSGGGSGGGSDGSGSSEPLAPPDFSPLLGWQRGQLFRWHASFGFVECFQDEQSDRVFGSDGGPELRKLWRVYVNVDVLPRDAATGQPVVPIKGQRMRVRVQLGSKGPYATELSL